MNRIANIDHDDAPEHICEKIKTMIHRRVTAPTMNAYLIALIDEGRITKAIKHVALLSAYPPAVWDEIEKLYEEEPPVVLTGSDAGPITVELPSGVWDGKPDPITVGDILAKLERLEKRERGAIVNSMPVKTARLHYAIANAYSALRAAIEANDLSILRED
jgi:hypothetical protein